MATSALARAFILCVRGPYYEYNGRGYARAMQFSRGQTSGGTAPKNKKSPPCTMPWFDDVMQLVTPIDSSCINESPQSATDFTLGTADSD